MKSEDPDLEKQNPVKKTKTSKNEVTNGRMRRQDMKN